MGRGDFAHHAPFCPPQLAGGRLKQFCPVPFWAGPGHTPSQVVLTTTSEGRYCDSPFRDKENKAQNWWGRDSGLGLFPCLTSLARTIWLEQGSSEMQDNQ